MSGRVLRLGIAVCLAAGGYVHAELYLHGYRVIPFVGPAFLVQASGSFAIAVLLVFSGSVVLRLAAAGLALGALGGFVLSRTIGVFGFVEYGLQPAPEALVSLLTEAAVLALLLVSHVLVRRRNPRAYS
ncbi:hypothetical protein [Amycolatopsis sp. NPDC058986]|uniref:hypothetical protein n=1 Tax=unclassified Amycolatopsis TaxID=2618356 RepID=UPI0036725F6B